MKRLLLFFMLVCATFPLLASEILHIPLADGETTDGKIDMPTGTEKVPMLVIFVHGTGPNTYLNKRKFGTLGFTYFDLFTDELNRRGIAFFTYNRRGVTIGENPPYFDSVDSVKYAKYLPETEASDIESMIKLLRKNPRLKKAKIALLGASEGTMIASLVADRKKVRLDDLFLFGYANDNLYDVIKWQFSGVSSMMNLQKYFDTNKDFVITRAEYESPDTGAVLGRNRVLQNTSFAQLDVVADSVIDAKDFAAMTAPFYKNLLQMTEDGNDAWIWKNYFRVTSAWLKAHFALEANKTRLLRVNIPIYIFQGLEDANAPAEGARDLQARFAEAGKTNLHCTFLEGHNHDLNFQLWMYKNEVSEGLKDLFDAIEKESKFIKQ